MRKTEPARKESINRLGEEKSPYLLQHADNPVEWYPWSEAAFEKARRENKPIFLSIGYSTCHWCHVMAHESFEDDETAALMNRDFVNIKVDREERPDIDRVYMTFVQATTGSGGWPMSVWLTPELKPFVGGTYFPPEDRYGHPGFKKVLGRIADAWRENREKISEQGGQILEALRESQAAQSAVAAKIDKSALQTAYEHFASTFDAKYGGFGVAPKFPRPVTFNFLTRFYAGHCSIGCQPMSEDHRQDADATARGTHALEIVLFTLQKMAACGMHDHVGGGFHRYSVDRYWHVPHFEKMLYDQAQLAAAYLDAIQILQHQPGPHFNPLPEGEADAKRRVRDYFESIARDVLDYVSRDLTSKDGGFFSAEDADSLLEHGKPEHAEGAFYVWTENEIGNSLGDDAELFQFHFGVQPHGNAPEGSDPHDEFRGKNILIERHSSSETAQKFGKTEEEVQQILIRCRQTLLSVRSKRPRPHLDDKVIAAWNGLMISACARAAQALNEPRYLEIAVRAARFVRQNLYDPKTGLMYRSYRNGRSKVEAFADDYAFVIQAFIDLYESSFDIECLKFAFELQQTMDRLFFDEKNGGYFSTSGKDSSVVLRMKDDNDSAEPAASSIAALNLFRLAQFTDDKELDRRARKSIEAFGASLGNFPSAMPQMLVGLIRSLEKPSQIVIAGNADASDTKELLRAVHQHFLPNKTLILADAGEGQEFLSEKNEALRAIAPIDGRATAYVCENFTCKAPVTNPRELAELFVR